MNRLQGSAWPEVLIVLGAVGFVVGVSLMIHAGGPPVPASEATAADADRALAAWEALASAPIETMPPIVGMGRRTAERLAAACRAGVTPNQARWHRDEAFALDARCQALGDDLRRAARLTAEAAQALWQEVCDE